MSEGGGGGTVHPHGDGGLSGAARRHLWIAALVLGVVGALVWPAHQALRQSPAPFKTAPPPSPPIPPRPSALLIDQTLAVWNTLETTLAPCDRAVARVAAGPLGPGRAPAAARRARTARDVCRQAGLGVMSIRPPQAAEGRERSAFEQALTQCQHLYVVEGNSHARLAQALDSGAQGAATFEAWADVKDANLDAMGCRIGFRAAARHAGMPSSLFETAAPA